jgi:glycosyltransferase involved in cell wall biosynthesis
MKTKKILIFTNNFLPGFRAGGPVTSIANLVQLIDKDFEIIIVTSNKDLGNKNAYTQVIHDEVVRYEKFNVIYLSHINIQSVQKTIKNCKPDLVYLNSFFSTFTQFVLFSLKIKLKTNIPVIMAPRGELQPNALAIKAFKKKLYLVAFKFLKMHENIYFHATDLIEYNCIEKMFNTNSISTLANVPKTQENLPLVKLKNELKIIFISRIRSNKNLIFALLSLAKCKGHIVFDIYGPIEDDDYWNACLLEIDRLPKNIVVNYKGVVEPIKIPYILRQYHTLLFPTQTENFGHVIVEAMQSGVVPIISDQTPWVNLSFYNAGWDLKLTKVENFSNVINQLYLMDENMYTCLSKDTISYINKKLDTNLLKQEYIEFFRKTLDFKARENHVQK